MRAYHTNAPTSPTRYESGTLLIRRMRGLKNLLADRLDLSPHALELALQRCGDLPNRERMHIISLPPTAEADVSPTVHKYLQ